MTSPNPGLCGRCAWVRRVGNRRGSTFFMCGLASVDGRYRRYPALPVLTCAGFEPEVDSDADHEDDDGIDTPLTPH